jgi:predicted O-methyltransferase YrrM
MPPIFHFGRFLLGLREQSTWDTPNELALLARLARGRQCVVEVGVFEGAASRVICPQLHPKGQLYLVDPYMPETRTERLFRISMAHLVCRIALRQWRNQIHFVRSTSVTAASSLAGHIQAELVFLDAAHDYESVLEDFRSWCPLVMRNGVIAVHDSHRTQSRPELTAETFGGVRLVDEITSGAHPGWRVSEWVDSLTVLTRTEA